MKQKTKFFKFIAFAISFILLLTSFSTLSVAAIDEDLTGSIMITNIGEEVTISIYQLTKVNVDDNGQLETPLYSWINTDLEDWVEENFEDYADLDYFLNNTIADNSSTAQAFYNALATAIKGGDLSSLTPTETKTVSDESVTFENCLMGTYLILTTAENGNTVYQTAVANLVPTYSESEWVLNNQTVQIKASSIQITKTVTTGSTENSSGTYETISYKIEADVPTYPTGSVSEAYYISDKMSKGLTLNASSIQVTGMTSSEFSVDLTANNTENKYYTLKTGSGLKRPSNESTSVDFLIEFEYENISAYEKIIVEYTATLNTDATIGTDGNTNNAYLDYSKDPNITGSITGEDSEEVVVYTYGIEVTKVDKSNQTTTLSGAQFELQNEGGTAYKFVKVDDGEYWLATGYQGETTTILEVDNNGKLCIYGLAEGTYYLEETKAPANYTKASTKAEITIDGDKLTNSNGIYELSVLNGKFFSLPITGGMGIAIFVASGIVLICLGIALFVFVVKKRKTNK